MKHLYILLIGLAFANVGCSQSKEETTEEKVAKPRFEEGTNNSLLWQITSPDLKDTSYIFGTMHLIQKQYFYFPESLKNLIKSTDLVVLEIGEDLNNPMKAMQLLKLEEGKEMFDFFNEAQEDSILVWAEDKLGFDEKQFRAGFGTMKPFIIVSLASEADMMKTAESYEKTILKIQGEADVKLAGLETIEEQMSIFDNLTDEEQAQMVMEAIREDQDAKNQLQQMMELYSRQNIDSLQLLIHDESDAIADKEAEFLTNRNHNWVPKIEEMIAKQRVFIAVGAGHLGGAEGVLELLRKEGYKVTPLKL